MNRLINFQPSLQKLYKLCLSLKQFFFISLRADIPLKISNARSIGHNKSYSNVPMKTYSAHYYVMFSIFTEINQAWTIFFFFYNRGFLYIPYLIESCRTVHISVWESFGWRGILTRVSP